MQSTEILTVLFSSTVVSAVFTALLNLFFRRRKDSLDNITKERKAWRDELRNISSEIAKSKSLDELLFSVNNLKVRINAYGIANNSLFSDSHIWHQIYLLEKKKSMSAEELKESKSMFVNIISCILKFDWERSKVEIKGNAQTKIVISSLILSFFLYSINWFLNHSISQEEIKSYFSYCIFYSIFVLFSLFVIIWADKWKNISQRTCYFFIVFTAFAVLCVFLFTIYNDIIPSSFIELNIFLIPFITLIYSTEIKILNYMKYMRYFILASAVSCNITKLDKKYDVFLRKNDNITKLISNLSKSKKCKVSKRNK